MDIKLETKEVIDYYDCEKIVGVHDLGDFGFTELIENDSYYCLDCSEDYILDLKKEAEYLVSLKLNCNEWRLKQINNDLKLIHYIRDNFNLDEILVHIYW